MPMNRNTSVLLERHWKKLVTMYLIRSSWMQSSEQQSRTKRSPFLSSQISPKTPRLPLKHGRRSVYVLQSEQPCLFKPCPSAENRLVSSRRSSYVEEERYKRHPKSQILRHRPIHRVCLHVTIHDLNTDVLWCPGLSKQLSRA